MSNQTNEDSSKITPTIAGAVDGKGNFIERGALTGDRKLTLVGTGKPEGQVKIYTRLGSETSPPEPVDAVAVDSYGGWHISFDLELGEQTYFQALNPDGDLTSKTYHVIGTDGGNMGGGPGHA